MLILTPTFSVQSCLLQGAESRHLLETVSQRRKIELLYFLSIRSSGVGLLHGSSDTELCSTEWTCAGPWASPSHSACTKLVAFLSWGILITWALVLLLCLTGDGAEVHDSGKFLCNSGTLAENFVMWGDCVQFWCSVFWKLFSLEGEYPRRGSNRKGNVTAAVQVYCPYRTKIPCQKWEKMKCNGLKLALNHLERRDEAGSQLRLAQSTV